MRRIARWPATLVLLLLANAGSPSKGTIVGRVLDGSGEPLPNAGVTVKGTRMGAATDSTGSYRIAGMPPGTYALVARSMGFRSMERGRVRVVADRSVIADFQLTPRPLRISDSPVIVGVRPITDTRVERPHRPEEDSLALFGGWEFLKSFGGFTAGPSEFKTWNGRFYFHEDGSYEIWGGDYGRDSLLCAGTFSIHRAGGHMWNGLVPSLWIDMLGCVGHVGFRQNLVHFANRDSIVTYPGGGNEIVIDAGYHVYQRIQAQRPR